MRKPLFFIIGILLSGWLPAQTFQSFIDRLKTLPENQRPVVADSFMKTTGDFPLIDHDTLAHFLFYQPARSVKMAGDATGWQPAINFSWIPGCDLWYCTRDYEADARLDYKLVINDTNWIPDPKNPHTCLGGWGPNSELRMPAWKSPPEVNTHAEILHGTLIDTAFHSQLLNNTRNIKIYLPSGYPDAQEVYPVVLFHDGPDYLSLGKAATVLDYLIARKMMVPVVGIFVPPVERDPEYAGLKMDFFTRFIVEELMPFIDSHYRISKDPSKRAMVGASNGGNIALYIGMRHPEQFGRIAAQSSNIVPVIQKYFEKGPKLNLELYLDIGTYDIAALIPMVRDFKKILETRRYRFEYKEIHEGHSWGNWSSHLRFPLIQFFTGSNDLQDNIKY